MKPNKYADLFIGLVLSSLLGVALFMYFKSPKPVTRPSHERIVYLKDSLEMEYYKSMLDTSFLFNHSEIR